MDKCLHAISQTGVRYEIMNVESNEVADKGHEEELDDSSLRESPQDADESRSDRTPVTDDHGAEENADEDKFQNGDDNNASSKSDDPNHVQGTSEKIGEEVQQEKESFDGANDLEGLEDLRTITLRCARREEEKWWNNWWDVPAEIRIMIYKFALRRPTPLQRPDQKLRDEWDLHYSSAQHLEDSAVIKESYELEIEAILRRPRTPAKGLVKKKNRILIDDLKAKILALEPDWRIEDLQQRRYQTRSTTSSLSSATIMSEWFNDDAVDARRNYQKFDIGLFLVNKKVSQEAVGIFYEVNTIRIVPELMLFAADRDSAGYHELSIDDESRTSLKKALHLQVRVEYSTIEDICQVIHDRADLRTVEIKFCDKMVRPTLAATIEPFKLFREIEMYGGTASHPKRFSIERVGSEWDPHCDLTRDIAAPRLSAHFTASLRRFWDLISEVVEGRRLVDCNPDNMFYIPPGAVVRPRVCPWL
ncbi:hypothetical protein BLS_009406 [Venturia inaequalis]|uniref:Uncharacterized protein n=1 Tax=Venturia inaequalis TaxID=5025 RepID=A0A8H3Z1L7_VENIN|nr:hypothetical protein BLS_009406 [Venturia inaequalis]